MGSSAGAINRASGTDQDHGLIDMANFLPFGMRTGVGLTSPSAHNGRLYISTAPARSVK
jgi:hypothetical protein